MGVYEYISGFSVLIYFFMFLIIINAKNTNIRNVFLGLIAISILWTGGSLLMRKQTVPGYEFWYHVSLFGIFLMPVVYFRFIMEYTLNVKKIYMYVYGTLMTSAFVVNLLTGLFIPPPAIQLIDGVEIMVYEEVGSIVYILFGLVAIMIIHMLYWFYKGIKNNPKLRSISRPVTIGIIALFAGNILLLVPAFSSFPVDILAGMINAFALLFALMTRSPFKLRMIMSESVGYATCLLLGSLTIYMLSPTLIILMTNRNIAAENWALWYLVVFSALLITYLTAWRMIIVGIFVKEDEEKSELLNQFSASVTTSLDTAHIFESSIKIIEEVVGKHRVYFAIKNKRKFQFTYSNQEAADLSISFNSNNPLLKALNVNQTVVDVKEFKLVTGYQGLREKEQIELSKLDITHIFGILDENEMHGILFVSDMHSRKKLRQHEIIRLQSICTMASIALKNSATYETAIAESLTDDLTGLYNRKYFYKNINKTFREHKSSSLSLVMISLDDFKLYNQLYGMKKSDKALSIIASILKRSVGKDGSVTRFSGKEFTLILPKYDVERTLELVDQINMKIHEQVKKKVNGLGKRITTSVGICVYPFGANNVNELIENVQQAIYKVKRNGKNDVKVFDTFVQEEQEGDERSLSAIYNEHKSTIYALTAAIDAKDHYTFSHSDNVAKYAVAFAEKLKLNIDIVENIRQAALLHDIGKIAMPEHVLNKPGRLTNEEYKLMQGHVDASIDIIRHLPSLDYVIPAVLGHHEKYDGTGYPRRLSGKDIPITARILCLADSVDAMLSKRAYKSERTVEEVIKIVQSEAGKQFDPVLAKSFVEMMENDRSLFELSQMQIISE